MSLQDEEIFCLDLFDDHLLVAVSGENSSRLDMLIDGALKTIAELPNVRYVWDTMVQDRRIHVATGIDGRLLQVDVPVEGEPTVTILLDAEQDNLLCLGRDGDGRIYTGSDGEGLVYRVVVNEDNQGSAFVLYDAPEAEIGALLVRQDGTVFAGTADAKQAKAGRLSAAAKAKTGRPAPKRDAQKPAPKAEPPKVDVSQGAADEPEAKTPKPQQVNEQPVDKETQSQAEDAGAAVDDEADPPATEPKGKISRPFLEQLLLGHGAAGGGPFATAPGTPIQEPTQAQRDELRRVIRQRLKDAWESGTVEEPQQTEKPSAPTISRPPSTTRVKTKVKPRKASKKGNAVYRISADGFVREVFRESVMVLRLADHRDRLLVGTGNDGQLYSVDFKGDQTAILADLESQQLPAMFGDDDSILLGTANPATVLRIDGGYAKQGSYTSDVLDAKQVSLWGRMHLTARTPEGSAVGVETRSGNVEDPDQAAWAPWSKAVFLDDDDTPADIRPRELVVDSPPGRFVQYRLTLEGDGSDTAVVDSLDIAYVTPNLQPKIGSIKASYGSSTRKSGSSPSGSSAAKKTPKKVAQLRLDWKVTDPNNDQLSYELEYRPDGSDRWLPLAEDLTATRYQWDTQLVPDGRYVVRLTATDRPDNTPGMETSVARHSDPVVIDNTPPLLDRLEHQVDGDQVTIVAVAVDAVSTITSIHYVVDGEEPWQTVLPKDLIFDSTREAFVAIIAGLEAGPHVIALRVIDARANARYVQVLVQVGDQVDN